LLMEQTFFCTSVKRTVKVKFEDPFILFSFVYPENEDEFYDFYIEDLEQIKPHFVEKTWVNEDMVTFINDHVK